MIESLHLVQFRNHHDKTIQFSPLTVIVGPNGRGKTNIIEALFLLSTGRSFRAHLDKEIIEFGQPFARLLSGPLEMTILAGERTKKQVRIHGKPVRLLHILGVQPTILFTPSSLALVDGSPGLRRQFIDILLSQTNPRYAHSLLEYQRVLKQRNELLHQIQNGESTSEALSLWDDLLVDSSIPVMVARRQMADAIHAQINDWYQRISARKEEVLEAEYVSSVQKRYKETLNEIELTTLYHERLRERRVAELQAARTLIGPHRDDIQLLLNKRPIAEYGSRGQMRSAVVALKLFEYAYMKEISEKPPTLLFDDVFSEFDPTRRKAILAVVPEAQIIFTATDLEHVGTLPSHAEVINLD